MEVKNQTCCHRHLHRSHTNESEGTLQLVNRKAQVVSWPDAACAMVGV